MILNGWDIVYGASISTINELLAANSTKLLTRFHYTANGKDEDDFTYNIDIQGEFDRWKITKGGSGKLINVGLKLKKGSTMRLSGDASASMLNGSWQQNEDIHIGGIEIIVQMELSFGADAQQKDSHLLQFNFTQQQQQSAENKSISFVEIRAKGLVFDNKATDTLKRHLGDAIVECLFANKSKIPFVFASVLTAENAGSWAAPRFVDFLYNEPLGSKEGFFNILGAVFSNTRPDGAQDAIDPSLYSVTKNKRRVLSPVYLAISADLFLQKQILPKLPASFASNQASFSYDTSQHVIRNNYPIPLYGTSFKGASEIRDFKVYIENDKLCTYLSGNAQVSDAIATNWFCTYKNPVVLDKANSRLSVQKDAKPDLHNNPYFSMHSSNPFAIIGDVAALAFNSFTGCITDTLGKAVSSHYAESFNVTNIFSALPIKWIDMKNIIIDSAGFQNNLYIRYKKIAQAKAITPLAKKFSSVNGDITSFGDFDSNWEFSLLQDGEDYSAVVVLPIKNAGYDKASNGNGDISVVFGDASVKIHWDISAPVVEELGKQKLYRINFAGFDEDSNLSCIDNGKGDNCGYGSDFAKIIIGLADWLDKNEQKFRDFFNNFEILV